MTNRKKDLFSIEQQILSSLKSGGDIGNALAPLVNRVMEAALEGEFGSHMDNDQSQNYRNSKSRKTVKSISGEFEVITTRDRNCNFEPQMIKKRQTTLIEDLDGKILNLYANGMSYSDIRDNLEEIYQVLISNGTISAF